MLKKSITRHRPPHSPPARKRRPRRSSGWGRLSVGVGLILAIAAFMGHYYSQPRIRLQQAASNQVLGVSTKLAIPTIIDTLNLERAGRGLGPLSLNDQLSAAALAKGEDMFRQDYWAHVGPDGAQPWQFIQAAGYAYQSAGENLARDFYQETDLVDAWMASPTHQANILNHNFSEAGLAVLDGIIDGKPVLLVVNLFAQPKSTSGWTPQVAIYDQSQDSLVLAGEVMPQGQLLTRRRSAFSPVQLVFAAVILLGVGLVLFKLRQSPYGRRRRKSR